MPFHMRNRYFIISDIVIVALCAYLSFVIRVEIFDLKQFWSGLLLFALLASFIFPLTFYLTGIYSIYWEY